LIAGRIKHIREHFKHTQSEFAKKIGISTTHMNRIEKQTREPSNALLKVICIEFNVNEQWLRTGEGEMFVQKADDAVEAFLSKIKATDVEKTFIKTYVKLNDFQRKVFQDYLKEVQKELIPKSTNDIEEYSKELTIAEEKQEYRVDYEVVVYGKVAGGTPILAIEEKGKTVKTNIKCDCALQLAGNSMSPEYNDGDILLIKRQPWLENGEVGIILIMKAAEIAEATCKKFYQENGNVVLKSINPAYNDIKIKNTDIMVFGKVVGKYGNDTEV